MPAGRVPHTVPCGGFRVLPLRGGLTGYGLVEEEACTNLLLDIKPLKVSETRFFMEEVRGFYHSSRIQDLIIQLSHE